MISMIRYCLASASKGLAAIVPSVTIVLLSVSYAKADTVYFAFDDDICNSEVKHYFKDVVHGSQSLNIRTNHHGTSGEWRELKIEITSVREEDVSLDLWVSIRTSKGFSLIRERSIDVKFGEPFVESVQFDKIHGKYRIQILYY